MDTSGRGAGAAVGEVRALVHPLMSAEPDREPLLALDVIDVDILPVVARVSASPTLLFALRRVCKLWRDAVDGIDRTSSVWQELLSAFGVQGRLPPEADKKAAFVMLLCEPRKLLRRCSVHVTAAPRVARLDDLPREELAELAARMCQTSADALALADTTLSGVDAEGEAAAETGSAGAGVS